MRVGVCGVRRNPTPCGVPLEYPCVTEGLTNAELEKRTSFLPLEYPWVVCHGGAATRPLTACVCVCKCVQVCAV